MLPDMQINTCHSTIVTKSLMTLAQHLQFKTMWIRVQTTKMSRPDSIQDSHHCHLIDISPKESKHAPLSTVVLFMSAENTSQTKHHHHLSTLNDTAVLATDRNGALQFVGYTPQD